MSLHTSRNMINNMVENLRHSILLVENDALLADSIAGYLREHGFEVSIKASEETIIEKLSKYDHGLMIHDILFPLLNYPASKSKIRRQHNQPIILLAGQGTDLRRLEEFAKTKFDYLAIRLAVLGKVNLLLQWPRVSEKGYRQIVIGPLTVNASNRCVWISDKQLDLTSTEYELLNLFAKNAGEVLTRDQISLALYGYEWNGLNRSVDVNISRLRRKLGKNTNGGYSIKSVRSHGYLLSCPD